VAGWLARPGAAVVEMDPAQVPVAAALARSWGADDVAVVHDLSGRARAVRVRVAR
jgi:hypothetical protein